MSLSAVKTFLKKTKRRAERVPAGRALVRFLKAVRYEARSVPALVRCLCADSADTLFLSGWIFAKNGRAKTNNWGDDINLEFFSESTGKRILIYPHSLLGRLFARKNFVCIGSVIDSATNRNSVVWGSGLINDKQNRRMRCVPAEILAVRGPKTREWLLAQGIDCPPVFGDPALLLPRFYTPKKLPRSRVGLIAHHLDLQDGNALVKRLAAEPGVRLIRVQGYENWRDFIDEICASDVVISASLHGLIVAEAYGVPALWVEFSEHAAGWDFKFHDFYESVGKPGMHSVKVSAETPLAELVALAAHQRAGTFDAEPLLAACPFELHTVPSAVPVAGKCDKTGGVIR